jgi:hypothetical protein
MSAGCAPGQTYIADGAPGGLFARFDDYSWAKAPSRFASANDWAEFSDSGDCKWNADHGHQFEVVHQLPAD